MQQITPNQINLVDSLLTKYYHKLVTDCGELYQRVNRGGCGLTTVLLSNMIFQHTGIMPRVWMQENPWRYIVNSNNDKIFVGDYLEDKHHFVFKKLSVYSSSKQDICDGIDLRSVNMYANIASIMDGIDKQYLPKKVFMPTEHFFMSFGNIVFDGECIISDEGMVEIDTLISSDKTSKPRIIAQTCNDDVAWASPSMEIDCKYIIPVLRRAGYWNSTFYRNYHQNSKQLVTIHNNIVKGV